ncbi:MAG: hypothetical protein MK165_10630 [Pirellulaceae bacterium]|nr:hypothetical protein [Pirellulaceae bacterium]
MSASNRASLITKTHKVLKKHFKPVAPPTDRTVFEHLLYACCLENSGYEAADEAFAKLQELFFDWNEVRVTTISELSEVMSCLADPKESAKRLKTTLHSVFETHYSFDIELLKKQNLGKSLKEIEKYPGVTPFVLSYITQTGLSGHSIPKSQGTIRALVVLGIVTQAEVDKRKIPGMERTIAKTKGVEFGSLLHQLGTEYGASVFSQRIRNILLEIAPDAKERFPKRSSPKKPKKPTAVKKVVAKKKSTSAASKKKVAKTSAAKTAKTAKKKTAVSKKSTKTKPAKKKTPKKKSTTKQLTRKKPR